MVGPTNNAWNSTIPAEVSKGGTGAATLTEHGILVGNGTGAITSFVSYADGLLLTGSAAGWPTWSAALAGNFSFNGTVAGATRSLGVVNMDNSDPASHAQISTYTGGTSGGDPYATYAVGVTTLFSQGIDNSDSDSFKLVSGLTMAGTVFSRMTTAGERTLPLQPAFLASVSSTVSNATGDGTLVDPITHDSEKFDQGGDYSTGTYTFTAPVTGRYYFAANVTLDDLTASHTVIEFFITTSNRGYYLQRSNPGAIKDPNDIAVYYGSSFADMDASDTAKSTVNIYNGNKVVDLNGNETGMPTAFSGALIC